MHLRLDLYDSVKQLLHHIVSVLLVRLVDALELCFGFFFDGGGGCGLFGFVLWVGVAQDGQSGEEEGEGRGVTHLLLVLLVLGLLRSLELFDILCGFAAGVFELLGAVCESEERAISGCMRRRHRIAGVGLTSPSLLHNLSSLLLGLEERLDALRLLGGLPACRCHKSA